MGEILDRPLAIAYRFGREALRLWVFAAIAAALLARGNLAAESYRPDRILIQPKPGADVQLNLFHKSLGVRVRRQMPALGGIQVLELPRGSHVPQTVANYQKNGRVNFAEPDYLLFPAASPNDPRYLNGSQWHLHNTGQTGGSADADIDAPEAWDTLNSASGIIIAIVDTGIRYTHEDLAGNMWVNPGEIAGNGLDDDLNGYIDDVYGINAAANTGDPMDMVGHGTQVAGIAGGVGNNGRGIAGVAWGTKLMACRFFDDAGVGALSDAVQAIDYARAKGAKVINASFISTSYSASLETAISNCRSAGIIFVAAAGNDTNNNDTVPYYPASLTLDNIVSVAATTSSDGLANYSNYGATSVDLGAPGSSITTTHSSANDAYIGGSGTSYAAPVVSGAFALMRARYPAENYKQIIDRVLAAVDSVASLSGKCVTGGRLNLAAALGPALSADFTFNPSAGEAPLEVNFTNTSFGEVTSWSWTFGDGSTSGAEHPTHTYDQPGQFIVTLVASGSSGSSSRSQAITVGNYQISSATYSWIDPAGMTDLDLANESVSPAQPLPFSFTFYGKSYFQLYVGANGLIGFDNQNLTLAANTDLPAAATPNAAIYPFWDDLNPGTGGGLVRIGTVGSAPNRKVVVSWVGVRSGAIISASYTFQAVLEEASNRIVFQYQQVNPSSLNASAAGKSATVGVEDGSGSVAAKYSYNGSTLLENSQAIQFMMPPAPHMVVSAAGDFEARGTAGGPFTPGGQTYDIANSGNATLNWTASKSAGWLTLSPTTGSLAPGQTASVTASINSSGNGLEVGNYSDNISFVNTGNNAGNNVRAVSLIVESAGVLAVTPGTGLSSMGLAGGPFTPGMETYTLTNSGGSDVSWTANIYQSWLSLSATGGTLAPGASTTVTVSIAEEATSLPPGSYNDTLVISASDGSPNMNLAVTLIVDAYAVLAAPQVSGSPWGLTLSGSPNRTYLIEASADLMSWICISTNVTDAEGNAVVTDPEAHELARRFYRATQR